MKISKLGFIDFNNKFEDGGTIDGDLPSWADFPSISPRTPLPPPRLTDQLLPPYSLLFHERLESIRNLIWKTTSSSTKKKAPSNQKAKLRKAILNCPPEEMLSLLKAQGLLNDDEPISTATKLKPVLPSLSPNSGKKI